MKFLCIAVVCLIGVAVAAPPAKFGEVHAKCQADPATHVDDEVFEKLKKGEKVDEPKMGAHSLCMHVNLGIQKENGDIDVEELAKKLEHLPAEKREQILKECTVKPAGVTAAGELAIALSKCIGEKMGHGPHEFAPHEHAHHEHH